MAQVGVLITEVEVLVTQVEVLITQVGVLVTEVGVLITQAGVGVKMIVMPLPSTMFSDLPHQCLSNQNPTPHLTLMYQYSLWPACFPRMLHPSKLMTSISPPTSANALPQANVDAPSSSKSSVAPTISGLTTRPWTGSARPRVSMVVVRRQRDHSSSAHAVPFPSSNSP